MYSRMREFQMQSDYYSQYQSMYDPITVIQTDIDSFGVEVGEDEEEVVYSDLYDTSIQQPSHPYNGDVTPIA